MLDAKKVRTFAELWVQAWNSRDLDQIMQHYASDAVLVSPVATKFRSDRSDTVNGEHEMRSYFRCILDRFPTVNFQLIETFGGSSSLIVYYVNHSGGRTCDFLQLDGTGRISKVVAHYSR